VIASDCNGVPSTLTLQIGESSTPLPTQSAYGGEKVRDFETGETRVLEVPLPLFERRHFYRSELRSSTRRSARAFMRV